MMAAKIAAEGNSTETSIFLWQDVYNTTNDPSVKENALKHLQLLRAQEDCKQIDTAGGRVSETVWAAACAHE